MLLTHLYQYFGVLLGCSQQGKTGFDAYKGEGSQYEVHKFMALDAYQVGYFITQVGLSAASFGVTTEDVTAVGMSLNKVFNYKCALPTPVVPSQGPQLQAICIADTCPLAANDTCSAYKAVVAPKNATESGSSSSSSSATGSPTASATAGGASTRPSGAASQMQAGSVAAIAGALFALAM